MAQKAAPAKTCEQLLLVKGEKTGPGWARRFSSEANPCVFLEGFLVLGAQVGACSQLLAGRDFIGACLATASREHNALC